MNPSQSARLAEQEDDLTLLDTSNRTSFNNHSRCMSIYGLIQPLTVTDTQFTPTLQSRTSLFPYTNILATNDRRPPAQRRDALKVDFSNNNKFSIHQLSNLTQT